MTSGFCFVWRGWRAVFGAFVGLGLVAFGFTGSAQAQLKEADYALPDELPPCLAFEGEPSAVRADCERLILDDATLPGVRRLARFQRARIVNRDDDAKLVEALKPFDFTGAPFALRGYTSVPVGQACYRLGDYACTRTNYDFAMFAGRLNYYGMRAYAEAIHKSDPPIDYVARLASFVKREQEGKTELAGYSQNLMIVMAALLELKDRQSERKDTLIELGRAKISDAAIANEVCWSLVTDLAAAFDAQMACNAAVRLAPGNGSLLDSRAVMHFALGDFVLFAHAWFSIALRGSSTSCAVRSARIGVTE
ncbi:MAG: hypothetical protein AAFY81_08060, partial [Pseudomonadota bacterium]